MLPVRASYVRLAARCDSCVKTVDAALQAVNNTLSAQAQDELSRAVMKLAGLVGQDARAQVEATGRGPDPD